MATQVKLLKSLSRTIKDLSLIGVAALVITLALPLSVIGEEVITLTTIMPGQDTLRVRRGVVGVTWRPTDVLSNADIGPNRLLIEGNVGIGTTANALFNAVGGTTKLAVTGSSSSTSVIGNTDASISIINTDDTTDNTAGLHFAWQNTPGTPNYAGASIVAQLGAKTLNQYPTGSLHFLTSTSPNAASTEKMTILEAGNVGIGTTAPGAALELFSSEAVGKPRLRITGTGQGAATHSGVEFFGKDGGAGTFGGGIFRECAKDDIQIWDATAARLVVQLGGNVGIGTASPGQFLDGSGNQVTALLLDIQPGQTQPGGIIVGSTGRGGAGTTRRQGYFLRRNDGWISAYSGMWKGSDTPVAASEYWENLVINNGGGGANIIFMTNLDEKMRIQVGGNVGIGTTNPTAKLHIGGTAGTDGIKFPDGTVQTTAGGGFGSWTNKDSAGGTLVKDAIYMATSDGFVSSVGLTTASGPMYIRTDSDSSPSTIRCKQSGYHSIDGNKAASCFSPVRKGDYWKVSHNATATIYWLPIGSGQCVKQ